MGGSTEDDGEVYSDSETEKKMKKKRIRHDVGSPENVDEDDEEARLRARLLARQAEKEKERSKKSEKHHHKKKKKRRDSSPTAPDQRQQTISASVVETVEIQTTISTTTKTLSTYPHDDDIDEGLGLVIQPPQLHSSSIGVPSHRKKHKKKEKRRSDEPEEERLFHHQKERDEGLAYEEKKDRRAREGWAAWKRSLVPGPSRGGGPPPVGKQRIERERRGERQERLLERFRGVETREEMHVRRERHRGDERVERRSRSRSPTDRRNRRPLSPVRSHHERKVSPTRSGSSKDVKNSREGRWLPQVNRETPAERSSSVTKVNEKASVLPIKDRNVPRIKVTGPSHSVPPSPELVLLDISSEVVQQATPTQDELEDKEETEVISEVSKSASSDSESNQSSSSSTDEGESLESGEHRSENSDERKKKGVPKEKYSKFDSSPEDEDVSSDKEELLNEPEDQKVEPEAIVSDDETEETTTLEVIDLRNFPEVEVREEKSPELPTYYPAINGCRYVEEFDCLNRIEEGTYGVVYRAKEKRTGEIVALKRLKMEKEKEGFPITSLREINMLLKAGNHTNVVNVREIVVGSNMDKIYLVMDYVEHDLKSLMETMGQPFLLSEVKTLLRQLLAGVHHLHDNWILHRDLKTSNLLLSHKGILKIGDFGLAREYGSPLKPYTPIVVTLWYRAPELLLGIKEYSTPIDVWSIGCIFAEFLTLKPLFAGKSEIEQLNKIFKMLGTPNNKIWDGYDELPGVKKMSFVEYPYNSLRKHFGVTLSDKGFNLLNKLLSYDPAKRIDAKGALTDDWFIEEPRPKHPDMFNTWPAKSEMSKIPRKLEKSSPKPPSGGKQFKQMAGESDKELLAGLRVKPVPGNQNAGFSLKFDAPKFR